MKLSPKTCLRFVLLAGLASLCEAQSFRFDGLFRAQPQENPFRHVKLVRPFPAYRFLPPHVSEYEWTLRGFDSAHWRSLESPSSTLIAPGIRLRSEIAPIFPIKSPLLPTIDSVPAWNRERGYPGLYNDPAWLFTAGPMNVYPDYPQATDVWAGSKG